MDVMLKFVDEQAVEKAYELDQLADLLELEFDLPVSKEESDAVAGRKDAGLTIALTLIGLGLTAVDTIVSALAYWKSDKPRYSITITDGRRTFAVENLSEDRATELVDSMLSSDAPDGITILFEDESQSQPKEIKG